jgi:hypothetical protein
MRRGWGTVDQISLSLFPAGMSNTFIGSGRFMRLGVEAHGLRGVEMNWTRAKPAGSFIVSCPSAGR